MCTLVCEGIFTQTSACKGYKLILGCLSLSHVSTLISPDSISLSLQLTLWLVSWKINPRILLQSPPPGIGVIAVHHGAQLLMWVRGIRTQVLMLFQQASYPQNRAPQPESALNKAFKLVRDFHTNQWALGTLHEQIVIGPAVLIYTGIA